MILYYDALASPHLKTGRRFFGDRTWEATFETKSLSLQNTLALKMVEK